MRGREREGRYIRMRGRKREDGIFIEGVPNKKLFCASHSPLCSSSLDRDRYLDRNNCRERRRENKNSIEYQYALSTPGEHSTSIQTISLIREVVSFLLNSFDVCY